MKVTGLCVSIIAVMLPMLGAIVLMWSDVQTMKETKLEYRELAEFRTEVTGKLSCIDQSIKGLDESVNRLLDERRIAYAQKTSCN